MQATQPNTIKDKIHLAVNRYLAKADQWVDVETIRKHSEVFMDQLCDYLDINTRKSKSDREP